MAHSTTASRRTGDERDQRSYRRASSRARRLATVPATGKLESADDAVRIVAANVGDHYELQSFLSAARRRHNAADFQAQLDAADYQPQHRLLAMCHERIVGHLQLIHRRLRFGPSLVPVIECAELAVLPECDPQPLALRLLTSAQESAMRRGSPLLIMPGRQHAFYQASGWIVGPRHCYSEIGPRQLLAHLLAGQSPPSDGLPRPWKKSATRSYEVRLWRRVEIDALRQLYRHSATHFDGAAERSEEAWHALIDRRGYDRIYVAALADCDDDRRGSSSICGYVAVRRQRVVESAVLPQHGAALSQLLEHVARDAVEREWHPLRLDGPPAAPCHELAQAAGGRYFYHDADQGQVVWVKACDLPTLATALHARLLERAEQCGAELPIDLPLMLDGTAYRLVIARRTTRLLACPRTSDPRGPLYCLPADFVHLLIGRSSAEQLMSAGRIHADQPEHLRLAECLFPARTLWLPPWDRLPTLL